MTPRPSAAYKAALKLDPTYTNAYLNLGSILCEQGECADSVELYDEALEPARPSSCCTSIGPSRSRT